MNEPQLIDITVPDWGFDWPMRVCQWLVTPGTQVKADQAILEITVAEVLMEVVAADTGHLVEWKVEETDTVVTGQQVATLRPAPFNEA